MPTIQIQLPDELHERLLSFASLRGRPAEDLVAAWIGEKVPAPRGDLFDAPVEPRRSVPALVQPPEPVGSASPDGIWRLWADGACSGNPGPGGWGIVVQGPDGEVTDAQGYRNTTNNRMEMRGAIAALGHVPRGARAIVHTDSRYVVDAITKKWIDGWKKRGWRKADGGEVKNVDLWEEMSRAMEGKKVTFQWVEGHAGNRNNERCDKLAVAAAHGDKLEPDRPG